MTRRKESLFNNRPILDAVFTEAPGAGNLFAKHVGDGPHPLISCRAPYP